MKKNIFSESQDYIGRICLFEKKAGGRKFKGTILNSYKSGVEVQTPTKVLFVSYDKLIVIYEKIK